MKKHLLLAVITCIFFLFGFTPLSSAQGPAEEREDEEAASEEMSDYVEGDVTAIDPALREISIKEDASGAIYQMSVRKKATFVNADSLSEISIGDTVNIDFYTFNGQMIATNINVEERVAREGPAPALEKVLSD